MRNNGGTYNGPGVLTVNELSSITGQPYPGEPSVTMTEQPVSRRDRLLAYIDRWQKRLRIQDWSITLTEEEPNRDNNGDVYIRPAQFLAEIAIDSRIPSENEEDIVLHECLEVLMDEIDTLVRELVEQGIPESLRAAYGQRREDTIHRVIYRLETALMPGRPVRPFRIVKNRE